MRRLYRCSAHVPQWRSPIPGYKICPLASGRAATTRPSQLNPSFPAKTIPEFIAYAKANVANLLQLNNGNPPPRTV
jgi:hypothetical protein